MSETSTWRTHGVVSLSHRRHFVAGKAVQGVKYAPFSAARAWLHRARVQGTPSYILPPESSKKPRSETRCGYFSALQHPLVYIVRYMNVPHCTGTFVPLFRDVNARAPRVQMRGRWLQHAPWQRLQ